MEKEEKRRSVVVHKNRKEGKACSLAMSSLASIVTPSQTQDVIVDDENEQIVLLGSIQVAVCVPCKRRNPYRA